MRTWRGFTLVEMLITVAVLAILTAIAIPSFTNMMERNQVATASNDLLSALLTARSEAVKREGSVDVLEDGSWSDGWEVELSGSGDCSDDPVGAGCLVKHKTTHDDISIAGDTSPITYTASGRAGAASFQLEMNDEKRCIIVSTTGRPNVTEGACP